MKKHSFIKLISLLLTVVFILSLPVYADQNEDKKNDSEVIETGKEVTQTQTDVKEFRDASYLSEDELPTPDEPTVVVENSDYFISAARAAAQAERENSEPDRSGEVTELEDGYYIIQSMYNGRYFHHTQANHTLNVWSYSEQTYQHWYISKNTDDTYTFRPLDDLNLAVEVYYGQASSGTPLTLYSYSNNNLSNACCFNVEIHDEESSGIICSIISALSPQNYALEVYDGPDTTMNFSGRTFSKQNGISVQLSTYNSNNIKQIWSIQKLEYYNSTYVPYVYRDDIEDGTYFIENKWNSRYLTKENMSNIAIVSAPYGGASQQWIVDKYSNGTYTFRLKANIDLYLELYCGVNAEGQPITIYNYTTNWNSPYIRFRLRSLITSYAIVPLTAPTMCIGVFTEQTDVYNIGGEWISKTYGVTVDLNQYFSYSTNRWKFYRVPSSVDDLYHLSVNETLYIEETDLPDNLKPGGSLYSAIKWYSSDTSIVTANFNSGDLYGESSGRTYINGCDGNGLTFFRYFAEVQTIPNGIYFLKNKSSYNYSEIESGVMQDGTNIEVQDYSGGDSQRWKFEYLINGYYSIKSMNSEDDYFLGVSNDSTTCGAYVVLREKNGALTDGMKWRVEPTASGAYKLIPKSGEQFYYALSEDEYGPLYGSDLIQDEYSNNSDFRDEWILKTFTATINIYYDHGFSVRFNETSAASVRRIMRYFNIVRHLYLETVGLDISYSVPTYFFSALDKCKGTVTDLNIDTLCSHGEIVHSNKDSVKADFIVNHTGDANTVYAFFSGHKICWYEDPDNPIHNVYNRSFSSSNFYAVFLLEITESYYYNTLFHELNHQFGAPDHYHEEDEDHNCINQLYCSDCNDDNNRQKTCIMYKDHEEKSINTILCAPCKEDILTHLRDHHFVD